MKQPPSSSPPASALPAKTLPLSICPWPDGRRWVYSITFDEALSDLHRFAIPILEEHGVSGHLEVVVGQLGQIRNLKGSTYHGMKHMGREELREMLARGWGVGNHSWSHLTVNAKTADQELRMAKEVLEEAIGEPVTVYCAPGNNSNMNPEALAACRRFGYLGAMSCTDALNRPGDADLLWLNRTFLVHHGFEPSFSEFDPFRNIQHARHDEGWIMDYLHCPLEVPLHPSKDCSAAQLRRRIETLVAEGGDDVWLARVEDAMDYRYTRRHTRIERLGSHAFRLNPADIPPPVRRRHLTLEIAPDIRGVEVDGRSCSPRTRHGRRFLDIEMSAHRVLTLR